MTGRSRSGPRRAAGLAACAVALLLTACTGGSRAARRATPRTTPPTTESAATTPAAPSSTPAGPGATAAATPTAPRPSFGAFLGAWGGHGRAITVKGDGSATATWRVYRLCSDDPTPPCDSVNGNQIVYGGNATLALSSVAGSVARGTVTSTSDPSTLPKGPVTLTLQPGDTLEVDPSGMVFCGPASSTGTCGA